MEKALKYIPDPETLICERCGKYESHYVFNKFYYRQRTIDFCDKCTKELHDLMSMRDEKQETTIDRFLQSKKTI